MGTRRKARELAMQALFYIDMQKEDPDEMLDRYRECFRPSKNALPFFLTLVKGVVATRSDIDELIEAYSDNWKVSRMSCVDRNVIRIAVFELLFCKEIPSKVSINEAVDVGKKFGTDESGGFINGILDSIRIAIEEERIPVTTTAETQLDE
jgi:N utilization substance protein B